MPFDKHLFISYAHIDNEPPAGENLGWITRFHRNLQVFLGQRLGGDAKIWRDDRLHGDDYFSDEIISQFPGTALLVSVVSPRYVKSEWCRKEVEAFCRAAEKSGGLRIQNRCRVVKIVKTPVELAELPPIMRETIGYDFYVQKDSVPLEIDPAFGDEMVPLFNVRVAALAQCLADTLSKLEKSSKNGEEKDAARKPMIYLAECAYDRRADRDAIETDLRAHGYTVLPDRQLPIDEDAYIREVGRSLEQCRLAIQLIGSQYGMVPNGPSGKSAPVLQNEVAMERSRTADLLRIVSIPPGVTAKHVEQQEFLAYLQNDAQAQCGADLIIGDLETLKEAIHSKLRKLAEPKAEVIPAGEKLAYIICDHRDMQAVRPLRKFLLSSGFRMVRLPLFTDDAAAVRKNHETLMGECDLVVHFWGSGDAAWKASVEADLFKVRMYRANKPLPRICTFITEPVTEDKLYMIDDLEPGMIDATTCFPEAALKGLLSSKGES